MSDRNYENEIHLRAICQLNLRNRQAGAYLLEENKRYSLRFGFTFPGIHPFVGYSTKLSSLNAWNEGVRGFPPNEIIRIHQKSFSDSKEREDELENRAERWVNYNPALTVLNYHQQSHTKKLSERGTRQQYRNHIFCSWGYRPGESSEQDFVENWLGKAIISFEDFYLKFKGETTRELHKILKEIFPRGFDESFLHWEQQLNTRMGLKTSPMQSRQLWDYAWKEFNLTSSEKKEIPHLIIANEINGRIEIEEKIASRLCPASVLIKGENGRSSVPLENYNWIRIKSKYTAAVVLEEKVDGYADLEHKFEYWWKPLLETPNCELVWEAKLSNSTFDNINLQRSLKFQKSMAQFSEKKGSYSVVANEEILDSIEAQKKIFQGDRTITVSIVFFLTRNSPRELDIACRQLTNIFPQGKLIREPDIVPELWRNKQPFVNRQLVGSLRQNVYLSSDLALPVLTAKSFDSRGIEFLTKEGGKPIYLNAQTKHHNELTIARTRKGKSTKLAEQIFTDLSYGIPSIMLDFGMVTGRTTCSDMVDFLGPSLGANVEVAYKDYNIIQTPNLTRLSPKVRQVQELTFQSAILSSLENIVLGDERGSRLAKRIRSFLDLVITNFFQDLQIQARYEVAHQKGIGSREWSEMPTLPELRNLAANINLDELGGGKISSEARDEVVMMLTSFIRSPFGQSFSRPSKVKFDVPFLNFSLRGARNEDEITLIGTIAQTIAVTRALEHTRSSVRVDEGSILLEKPALVYNTAETVVNGGKSGISVSLLAQDIPSVANCAAGSKLLTNTDVKMIGSIDDSDIDGLAHYLKKPPEVFYRNAREDFDPNPIDLCSYWLMLAEGTQLYLAHYPSPELMALVASNPEEQKARERYLESYADSIEAISIFARDYERAKKTGMPMSELAPSKDQDESLLFV